MKLKWESGLMALTSGWRKDLQPVRQIHELAGSWDKLRANNRVRGTRPAYQRQRKPELSILPTLGRRRYGLGKRLCIFRAMYPPVEYIIPCDVGIEMMLLGLLFEFGLQLS